MLVCILIEPLLTTRVEEGPICLDLLAQLVALIFDPVLAHPARIGPAAQVLKAGQGEDLRPLGWSPSGHPCAGGQTLHLASGGVVAWVPPRLGSLR